MPVIRADLLGLFEVSELKKYMTADELAGLPGSSTSASASSAAAAAAAEEEGH
jgi:succinate dehydrogenase / fumarate reductase flavoprotein subunit